jgi:ketosteroid isomerase-like protein
LVCLHLSFFSIGGRFESNLNYKICLMKPISFIIFIFMLVSCGSSKNAIQTDPTPEVVRLMNVSADDWNRSDLDRFMSIYDSEATFMTGKGPVGIAATRENYQKAFFKDGKVMQQLRFEEMVVRPLGDDHALVTGKFVLYGGGMADRTGRYSLIFVKRASGWKMLHDHSS